MVSCWDKMIDGIRPGDIVIELGCKFSERQVGFDEYFVPLKMG